MFCGAIIQEAVNSLNSGKFYEAHQLYKTLYLRHKARGLYARIEPLLYNAVLHLLSKDEQLLGIDLAFYYIENLYKTVSKGEEMIEKSKDFENFLNLMKHIKRQEFINRLIKWSCSYEGQPSYGAPFIHELIGDVYSLEREDNQARFHLLRCSNGEKFANLLIRIHSSSAYAKEVDIFVAQAVLQQLCMGVKSVGETTFNTFVELHPLLDSNFPHKLPLLNFIHFLLKAIDLKELKIYKVLCEKYSIEIERDPDYAQYLERIGQIYFGLKPPERQKNMFEIFFDSVMSNDDTTEENSRIAAGMDDVD